MRNILLPFFIIICSYSAIAQDFQYGSHTDAEMDIKRYDKDTSAHAVVLREFGKASIATTQNNLLIYEYHVKIKIFDGKAFAKGNIEIEQERSYDNWGIEKANTPIKATTYYKDDKGVEHHTDLDTSKIYRDKTDDNVEIIKFAMPDLRNGCIIEYTYKSKFFDTYYSFHSWVFQTDIPKMYSEYQTDIPGTFNYNIAIRGHLALPKTTSKIIPYCYNTATVLAECRQVNYVMEDVPAFVEERYMTSPVNYRSAIYFYLADVLNDNGQKIKVAKTWSDVDADLQKHERFGVQLKRKGLLKDRIPKNIFAIPDTLEKARAIYSFLQKWFKWDHYYGIVTHRDGIKAPFEKHSGDVADINISLIDGLEAAGIKAEAVILSTRQHGMVSRLYPTVTDFNYVVARITIDNKTYLLDATDPLLAFGTLPLRCINGQGRVFSLNKPSYWIDLVAEQKMGTTVVLDLTLNANGKATGTATIYSMGYAAHEKRIAIKKFNTTDEYIEEIGSRSPKIKILKSEISNLDTLDEPLTEKYEIELKGNILSNTEYLSINPCFWNPTSENPFKLNERTYPVDMYSASDDKLFLTLHYPDNYVLDSQPSPVGLLLPNKGGKFNTAFQANPGIITYTEVTQLNRSLYSPQEYPYLKEFYNKIIQTEKADIIFKKKP
jgi:hypothetical protein